MKEEKEKKKDKKGFELSYERLKAFKEAAKPIYNLGKRILKEE